MKTNGAAHGEATPILTAGEKATTVFGKKGCGGPNGIARDGGEKNRERMDSEAGGSGCRVTIDRCE